MAHKQTQETKDKISNTLKKKNLKRSAKHREQLRIAMTRRTMNQKTLAQLRRELTIARKNYKKSLLLTYWNEIEELEYRISVLKESELYV